MNFEFETPNDFILVFDTETTGLTKGINAPLEEQPYITQISAILYQISKNEIVEFLNYYVKIGANVKIHEEAQRKTGITHELCQKRGKSLKFVLRNFYKVCSRAETIVAHNLEFDKSVVLFELQRLGVNFREKYNPFIAEEKRFICTMKETIPFCKLKRANYHFGFKPPKLLELYKLCFGYQLPDENTLHNSAVDTIVCLRCVVKLFFKIQISEDYIYNWIDIVTKKITNETHRELSCLKIVKRKRMNSIGGENMKNKKSY